MKRYAEKMEEHPAGHWVSYDDYAAELSVAIRLLERYRRQRKHDVDLNDDTNDFLSCTCGCRQPAAPTPVNLGSDFGVVPDIKSAAPTPVCSHYPHDDESCPWHRPAASEPSAVDWTAVRNADLDAAMKRANSAEQELRETAGELEKARADVLTFTSRALLSEAALTAATALLKRFVSAAALHDNQWLWEGLEKDIVAFLSRVPAQSAAPTPVPGICPKCDDPSHAGECSRARPKWPAAPEPSADQCRLGWKREYERAESAEARLAAIDEWTHRKGKALVPHGGWSDSFGDGMRNAHTQVSALLAPGTAPLTAPEPSVCARFSGCEGSGYATILGTGGDAAPCEECKLGKVYKRAERAEAQLAAVREALTGVHVMNSQDAGQVVCASVVDDALSLLNPAASPGAKEETK